MPEQIDGEDVAIFNVGSVHLFDREPEDRVEVKQKIPFGFQAPVVKPKKLSNRAKKRRRRDLNQ